MKVHFTIADDWIQTADICYWKVTALSAGSQNEHLALTFKTNFIF